VVITLKDYNSGQVNGVPIEMSADYRAWLGKNLKRVMPLLADNREIFKRIWGKPDWHFDGEFYFHVWVKEHRGETFLVFTAKTKGTCVEMVRPNNRGVDSQGKAINSFVASILKAMRE